MELSFIVGYGASMLPVLSRILSKESEKLGFEYLAISDFSSEKYVERIAKSDAIFVYAYELPEKVERAIENSKAKIVISASDNHYHLSKGSTDVLNKAIAYFKIGGEDNLRNLVRFMLKSVGLKVEVEDVKELPWHGIYHPEFGLFRTTNEYLKVYNRAYGEKPLVGIIIHRTYWLYGNLKHFNAVVKAFEDAGLGVLPVFTQGWRDELLNTPSKEDTIREFFIIDGRVIVDAILNSTYFFLLDHGSRDDRFKEVEGINLLKTLNVPIIQPCLSSSQSVEEWYDDPQGLDYLSQVYTIIMPEVDGLIEPVYLAGTKLSDDGVKSFEPYTEHARYLARRIKKWIELRKKKPEERKIAIVLINPPCKGLEASVAVGFGLDVPESIARLLKRLKEAGYKIDNPPNNGKELIRLILERKAISEFRWTSVEEIVERGGAIDFVDIETYNEWFNELPSETRQEMEREWGRAGDVLAGDFPSGDVKKLAGMVYQNKFVIPGLLFGNVFITPQPKFGCAGSRCDGKVCRILHNPTIPPPHQWLAVYRWITRKFKADVIVHFGTHGYLEFRPGKGVGLSTSCWPEISVDDVPHLYVYNVSNPMEGVLAKRRSYATIVDHVYPPMAMAEVFEEIESLLAQYSKAKQLGDFERAKIIYEDIIKKSKANNIPIKANDPEKVIEEIHRYVEAVRETQIEMGLHVFAHPRTDKLAEYVATVMAYDSNNFPSIRRVLAEYISLNYDEMKSNPSEINKLGLTNSETLHLLHKAAVKTVDDLLKVGNDENINDENIIQFLNKNISDVFEISQTSPMLEETSSMPESAKITSAFKKALEIASKIKECVNEYNGFISGISGEFVEPGASGSLTRGKIEILPTGRNFFAVDPTALPTESAWKVGVETANKLLRHYLEKHERYPESIGEWLWSIDGYKADGEQIAQILYLLGVRPIWINGSIKGLEIIPLEELKRPRIDVVIRISGIVRDTLPNYIYMIDEAVSKVAALDESPEMNYIRKHYLEHVSKIKNEELALCRVFCAPPGSYGSGVNYAVEASAWQNDEDLAKAWVQWSGYAYTRKYFGEEAFESLILNLKNVDVVTRDHVSDEHDILNCCCYFSYHGGFYNTVKSLGKEPEIVIVDTKDVSSTTVREMKDEIERVVRAKLLNPVWISEMKKHGYRGANEFSKKIVHLYGWSATTKLVDKWVFDEIANTYVLDDEMRKWFEENNVYAAEEITRRLFEAAERGLWDADDQLLERLREVYGEIEGILEDSIVGDVQGGVINTYTMNDVENWSENARSVSEVWSKLKESLEESLE